MKSKTSRGGKVQPMVHGMVCKVAPFEAYSNVILLMAEIPFPTTWDGVFFNPS